MGIALIVVFVICCIVWECASLVVDRNRFVEDVIFKDDGKPGWWALVTVSAETDGNHIFWYCSPCKNYPYQVGTVDFTVFARKCETKKEAVNLAKRAAEIADSNVFKHRNCGIMYSVKKEITHEFAWKKVLRNDWVAIAKRIEKEEKKKK